MSNIVSCDAVTSALCCVVFHYALLQRTVLEHVQLMHVFTPHFSWNEALLTSRFCPILWALACA